MNSEKRNVVAIRTKLHKIEKLSTCLFPFLGRQCDHVALLLNYKHLYTVKTVLLIKKKTNNFTR